MKVSAFFIIPKNEFSGKTQLYLNITITIIYYIEIG